MNTRLKQLRKAENLSQEEFGKKIFLSQYQISLLEKGKRNLTDRVIETICKEFNVNSQWLKEGTGDMYIDCLKDAEVSEESKKITKMLFELDPEDRNAILNLIELFKNKKK